MDISLEKYLAELKELVNIDSPTNYPIGVSSVADFFEARYEKAGFNVERIHFSEDIGPLLKITNGEFENYDLLFIGHMDTVFPTGTASERPFSTSEERAYGPGIGDMKAGLLNLYHVLNSLQKSKQLDDLKVCIIHNSDHEGLGCKYSRSTIENLGRKSRFCLVLEAARASGAAVSERKGIMRYKVSFEGIASHAGNDPAGGRNAIHELAHWIIELQKLSNYSLETTVNVTLVKGGVSNNMIPPFAELEIDCRIFELEEAERINSKLEELKNKPFINGVTAFYKQTVFKPPMKLSKEARDLCVEISRIAKDSYGIDLEWIKAGGGSDGNYVSAIGTTTLDGLGPISGGPHSVGEYVLIESIKPRMKLLEDVIRLLSSKSQA